MAQVGDIVKKGDVICTYKEYIYESQDRSDYDITSTKIGR